MKEKEKSVGKMATKNQPLKIYKCRVRIVEIREGFDFVEAPSMEIALDSAWLRWAEQDHGYLEHIDVEPAKTRYEILTARVVRSLGQIPEDDRDGMPWCHPNHEREDQRTFKELLSPDLEGFKDNEDEIADDISRLEDKKRAIDEDIEGLRRLLKPTQNDRK